MRLTEVLRWAIATGVLFVALGLAQLASYSFGSYYLAEAGPERLREQSINLLFATVVGVSGVAAFRALLGRRPGSPWLLLGLAIPTVAAANHAGLIG
jgi:hypothetical protein